MQINQRSQSKCCQLASISISCQTRRRKDYHPPVSQSTTHISPPINPDCRTSLVRSLLPLESRPGLLSLLAGKPNVTTFPFTSMSFTTRSPSAPSQDIELSLTNDELAIGLQYGLTAGLDDLITWVYGLQELAHGRKKGEGWRTSIGAGSQDLIYKVRISHKFLFQNVYVLIGCQRYTQRRRLSLSRISRIRVSLSF